MIEIIDVLRARARIRRYVRHTPLFHSRQLSALLGRPVYLKLENQQETNSFKLRGAFHFIMQLSPAQRERGLVAASAGNHGQGVALAASLLGLPVTICVPGYTPQAKQEAIRGLGARLEVVSGGYTAAHDRALAIAAAEGCAYVPAYEDHMIVAGQGTVALEIFEDLPDVAAILTPVGGGGLCAGAGVVAAALNPQVPVVGIQTEVTPAMYRSLQAGRVVSVDEPPTLCEGLAGDIDPLTFAYAQKYLRGMDLVPESAVAGAIAWLVREHRLLAEGSGAVGVACLLDPGSRQRVFGAGGPAAGEGPVAIIISGGNIDAAVLTRILAEHPAGGAVEAN